MFNSQKSEGSALVSSVPRGGPVLELSLKKQNMAILGNQLVAVGEESVEKALARVVACQGCTAVITRPFGLVLAETLGHSGLAIEYVMSEPAFCPNCSRPMFENTF